MTIESVRLATDFLSRHTNLVHRADNGTEIEALVILALSPTACPIMSGKFHCRDFIPTDPESDIISCGLCEDKQTDICTERFRSWYALKAQIKRLYRYGS